MRKLVIAAAVLAALRPWRAGRPSAGSRRRPRRRASTGSRPSRRRWDVVPTQHDPISGMRFDPAKTTFPTVIYRALHAELDGADARRRRARGDDDGIPGPLIRARVGDTILVHFKNLDPHASPHSMHFHGVHYASALRRRATSRASPGRGADVKPGRRSRTSCTPKARLGRRLALPRPLAVDGPSIAGGMYGACRSSAAKEKAPDREFVVAFESQLGFNTIDGRAFIGNTPIFRAKVGDVVQWDVIALGDASPHLPRPRPPLAGPGRRRATCRRSARPRASASAGREDAPGTWLYHCHVETHMMNGMIGLYVVTK